MIYLKEFYNLQFSFNCQVHILGGEGYSEDYEKLNTCVYATVLNEDILVLMVYKLFNA